MGAGLPHARPTPLGGGALLQQPIVGNFMVYQDRLETNLLQLCTHPEN